MTVPKYVIGSIVFSPVPAHPDLAAWAALYGQQNQLGSLGPSLAGMKLPAWDAMLQAHQGGSFGNSLSSPQEQLVRPPAVPAAQEQTDLSQTSAAPPSSGTETVVAQPPRAKGLLRKSRQPSSPPQKPKSKGRGRP